MKKTISLSLFYLLLFNSIFGQTEQTKQTFFFDENQKQTDAIKYFKKVNSFLYQQVKKETDSTFVLSMTEKYKFGKLKSTELKQIKKILVQKTGANQLENKTIVISFVNTLYGEKAYYQAYLKSHNPHHKNASSKPVYKAKREEFDKTQKQCFKKYRKKSVSTFYFYKNNEHYNYISKNFTWNKIPTSLYRYFFSGNRSYMLIIKPDGNYFRYQYMSEKAIQMLLKNNWDDYIYDYQVAKKHLKKEPVGFFKDIGTNRVVFHIDNSTAQAAKTQNKRQKNRTPGIIYVNSTSEAHNYMKNNSNFKCFSHASF